MDTPKNTIVKKNVQSSKISPYERPPAPAMVHQVHVLGLAENVGYVLR